MIAVNSRWAPAKRPKAKRLAASLAGAGMALGCAIGLGVAPATSASAATATPSAAIAMANTGFAVQNGVLYGWGDNSDGELGDGTTTSQPTPVPVAQGAIPDGVSIVQIAAATDHTLALGSDGKVYAWGTNNAGQLGDDTTTNELTPVAVAQGAIPDGVKIVKVVAIGFESFALGDDGVVYEWGEFIDPSSSTGIREDNTPVALAQGQVPDGVKIVDLAASDASLDVALIGDDGNAYAFGPANGFGELGSADTSFTTTTPVRIPQGAIPDGVKLVQVAAGGATGFANFEALGDDGHAYGWGAGGGQGTATSSDSNPTPVAADQGAIPDGVKLVTLASLETATIAIGDDGHAYAWGLASQGQLGNGTTTVATTPVAVSPGAVPNGVKLIAVAGQQHTAAALGDDGNVYTWGSNSQGEIGDGTTGLGGSANDRNVPTRVLLPAQATTTALTVTGQQTAGQPVTLTATLTPGHAAGTVQFNDGSTSLGSAPVTAGAASLTTSALSVGEHSITASFTPTDPTEYVASTTASPLNITIAQGTLTVGTPTITGNPQVGSTLTADPGTWTDGTTFTYQWSRNGTAIPGATSATYTPVADDSGTQITVTVTGSKDGFTTGSATSAPVNLPAMPNGNTNPGGPSNPGGNTNPGTTTSPGGPSTLAVTTRKPKVKLTPANDVLKPGVTATTLILQFKSLKVGTKLAVKLSEPKSNRKGAAQLKTKSAKVTANHMLRFATGKLPTGVTKIRFYETVRKGKTAKPKLVKTETVHVTAKNGKK